MWCVDVYIYVCTWFVLNCWAAISLVWCARPSPLRSLNKGGGGRLRGEGEGDSEGEGESEGEGGGERDIRFLAFLM